MATGSVETVVWNGWSQKQ